MKKEVKYKLLPHQKRLLNSNSSFTAMVCGRRLKGAGKSYISSLLAALKLIQGERIIVFAQNYRSLTENLLYEVTLRLDELIGHNAYRYEKGKKITLLSNSSVASKRHGAIFGATYENIDAVRGFTQINSIILDEGALSPNNILMVAGPCIRGLGKNEDGSDKEGKIYVATTPLAGSWLNLYIQEHLSEINLIQAKTTDNKFISNSEYKLMQSTFTNEALRRQELDGELLNLQAENSILSDIHYKKELIDEIPEEGLVSIGIDGSGYGQDKTVITYRLGFWYKQFSYDTLTGHEARNEINKMLSKHPNWRVIEINIDMAYGQTIYENLYEEFECCELVNFGSKPTDEKYLNRRAELYFDLVDGIRNGLPITDDIERELTFTLFEFTQNGKLKLIPKEEIKEIIKHSPDKTDSLALTFANGDRCSDWVKPGYEENDYYINPED